jgi:hypothetical protein
LPGVLLQDDRTDEGRTDGEAGDGGRAL